MLSNKTAAKVIFFILIFNVSKEFSFNYTWKSWNFHLHLQMGKSIENE